MFKWSSSFSDVTFYVNNRFRFFPFCFKVSLTPQNESILITNSKIIFYSNCDPKLKITVHKILLYPLRSPVRSPAWVLNDMRKERSCFAWVLSYSDRHKKVKSISQIISYSWSTQHANHHEYLTNHVWSAILIWNRKVYDGTRVCDDDSIQLWASLLIMIMQHQPFSRLIGWNIDGQRPSLWAHNANIYIPNLNA